MKIKISKKPSLSLNESSRRYNFYGNRASIAADLIEEILQDDRVDLSDKSNSISGLLLREKDKIDSAASQTELVKVCSDILADKGGAKAQQFLSVLKTKKNHYAALKCVYDFILAGEGQRSPDSRRKTGANSK